MKRSVPFFLIPISLFFVGCHCSKCQSDPEVVSERYIHKYGYDVSPKEWQETSYPGQVVTTLRDGTVITASYDDHQLHGEMTKTFPHSQKIAERSQYKKGLLVKKMHYNISGSPEREETYLSPSHIRTRQWYKNGTPMSMEERLGQELIEAEYYNARNETDYSIKQGEGTRIIRDDHERISLRETISQGYPILRETFHAHGIPHTVAALLNGHLHGEKKVYALTGELIASEHYDRNALHGKATYYQNGARYLEIDYTNGLKNGAERHFVDGTTLVEETEWYEGKKHGPSTVYFDGMSQTRWYYNNQIVSKEKYRQLSLQEENIAIMQARSLRNDDALPSAIIR